MNFYDMVSPYIVVVIISWTLSHLLKYFIECLKSGKRDFFKTLFSSGGMPSSHTATVVSLTTVIGLIDGFNSAIFGLSALFSIIVMYDATKVRRSSGEQGEVLHKIIEAMKLGSKKPYLAKGHTPVQVFVGAIFGILVGYIVFITTL